MSLPVLHIWTHWIASRTTTCLFQLSTCIKCYRKSYPYRYLHYPPLLLYNLFYPIHLKLRKAKMKGPGLFTVDPDLYRMGVSTYLSLICFAMICEICAHILQMSDSLQAKEVIQSVCSSTPSGVYHLRPELSSPTILSCFIAIFGALFRTQSKIHLLFVQFHNRWREI